MTLNPIRRVFRVIVIYTGQCRSIISGVNGTAALFDCVCYSVYNVARYLVVSWETLLIPMNSLAIFVALIFA